MDYPIIISKLSDEDGGGYMGQAPDLMGCMSDGETPEEALANTQDAVLEWLDTAKDRGLEIPAPHSKAAAARRERDDLLAALRDLTDGIDHIDGKLEDLTRRLTEIEDRIENMDAWDRFASVTGVVMSHPRQLSFYD